LSAGDRALAKRPRPTMVYREFKPGKALRPYVVAYWFFRVAPDAGEIMHSIPLTGAATLSVSVSAGRIILVGPRTRPLQVIVRARDEFWVSTSSLGLWKHCSVCQADHSAMCGPKLPGLRAAGGSPKRLQDCAVLAV
jgi:hypothetical protein